MLMHLHLHNFFALVSDVMDGKFSIYVTMTKKSMLSRSIKASHMHQLTILLQK